MRTPFLERADGPAHRSVRPAGARPRLGLRPRRRTRPASCWPSPRRSSRRSTLLEAQEPELPATVEAVREPGARPSAEDDPLNAIVRRCRVRAEGCEGILSGQRVAMKDSVAIAGIPLTCGSAILQGFVPSYDATVTDRILRAGAEIVCITNMDDLAFSGGGESSWYGPTRNPFDPERSAGGSSSGSAAALSYDGIDLAVGCDQGGSIRAPASWCGVVGLKPTHSLVPYTGIAGIDADLRPLRPDGAHGGGHGAAAAGDGRARTRATRASATCPRADYVGAVERAGTDLARPAHRRRRRRASPRAWAPSRRRATPCARRPSGSPASAPSCTSVSLPEHLQAGGVAFAGFVEGMTALMTSGGNGIGWRGRYWEELAPAHRGGPARARQRALAAGQDRARRRRAPARAPRRRALRAGAEPAAVAARGLRPGARRHRRPAHADHAVPRVPARRRAAHERARPARLGEPRQHLPDRHVRASRDLAPARAGRRPAGRRHARRAPLRRRAPARDRRHLRAGARLGAGEALSPSSARRT